jgi:hypothetical protein
MDKNQILIALSESDKTKFGKEDFSTQSIPQKVFSSIWALESDVNDGGFSTYFQNGNTETVVFVVEALNIIGAPQTAEICRRAIECAFPEGLPSTLSAENFSGKTLDQLSALDDLFYTYPHNLSELLFAYASAHPEEFGKLIDLN